MSDLFRKKRPSEVLLEQAKDVFDSLGLDPSHKTDLDFIAGKAADAPKTLFEDHSSSKGFTI